MISALVWMVVGGLITTTVSDKVSRNIAVINAGHAKMEHDRAVLEAYFIQRIVELYRQGQLMRFIQQAIESKCPEIKVTEEEIANMQKLLLAAEASKRFGNGSVVPWGQTSIIQ